MANVQRTVGIARNLLSDRLGKLVGNATVQRRLSQLSPPRYEYPLPDKGRHLYGVVVEIICWGDRWATDSHHRD